MTDFDDTDLEALLRGTAMSPAFAPGFADRVMARVATMPQDAPPGAALALPRDPLPWWIRAVGQPATALALALAGLATGFAPQLLDLSRGAAGWAGAIQGGWIGTALAPGSDPGLGLVAAGTSLALLPLLSIALYRLGARITTVRFAAPPIAALPAGSRRP
jgi:hypothetical protein